MNLSKKIKELKNKNEIDSKLIISTIQNFRQEILQDKSTKITPVYHKLNIIQKKIITNSSNVLLNNLINYSLIHLDKSTVSKLKSSFLLNSHKSILLLKENKELITHYTIKKIKKRSSIFVYGNNSLLIHILKKAKKIKKKFEVITVSLNTDKTNSKLVKELKKSKIKTKTYHYNSLLFALEHSDIILLYCTQITQKGIISEIGSGIISEIARKHNIPVYVCTNSLKFSKIKFDLNKKTNKNKIINYEFEEINSNNITGIISELGIFTHDMLLHELKREYKYLF